MKRGILFVGKDKAVSQQTRATDKRMGNWHAENVEGICIS
jgi:hypothetical protein